jgi:hypothetical protein
MTELVSSVRRRVSRSVSTVLEHGPEAPPADQPAPPRRMPLVTVPTVSGEPVRICCELHTPWTQLLGTPGAIGGSAAHQQASGRANSSAGGDAAPSTAAAHAAGSTAGGTAGPTRHADDGLSPSAGSSDPAHAALDSGNAGEASGQQRGDWGRQQPQQQEQRRQHARVNDPGRQKLLIVASLGVEGGSGWFSHVAAHFAGLRDPATGQPAADVVTFDNRWAGQFQTLNLLCGFCSSAPASAGRRRWSAAAGQPHTAAAAHHSLIAPPYVDISIKNGMSHDRRQWSAVTLRPPPRQLLTIC